MAYIVFDFVIIELVELVFCCPFGHRSDCSKEGSRVALPREERETRPTAASVSVQTPPERAEMEEPDWESWGAPSPQICV